MRRGRSHSHIKLRPEQPRLSRAERARRRGQREQQAGDARPASRQHLWNLWLELRARSEAEGVACVPWKEWFRQQKGERS